MARKFKAIIASTAIAGLALTGCSSESDVPDLESIETTMWDTMAASDAMSMTGSVPESMGEDAAIIEQILGGSVSDVEIYGSLKESATAIRLSEDQEPIMLFFGDEAFIEMSTVLNSMSSIMPGGAPPEAQEQMEAAAAEFAGKYLDVSSSMGNATTPVDMSEVLSGMRQAAEAGETDPATGFDFGALQPEGSYQQLSMDSEETGWFYSDTGLDSSGSATNETFQYIAMTADHDEPRLEQVRNGEQTLITFDWNDEVEIPERPSEENLVDQETFMNFGQ